MGEHQHWPIVTMGTLANKMTITATVADACVLCPVNLANL